MMRRDMIETTVVAEDGSQATVARVISDNQLVLLWERGTISEEQYDAAIEIGRILEEIERTVGFRSASLEARVDNSGSAKNLLIEHLSQVQIEATYNAWRQRLPVPRRMVIDMVLGSISVTVAARRYRMRKTKARSRLIDALDIWLEIRAKILKEIDEHEVEAAHIRAGGGTLA